MRYDRGTWTAAYVRRAPARDAHASSSCLARGAVFALGDSPGTVDREALLSGKVVLYLYVDSQHVLTLQAMGNNSGLGLVAATTFRRGDTITRYAGPRLIAAEAMADPARRDNLTRLSREGPRRRRVSWHRVIAPGRHEVWRAAHFINAADWPSPRPAPHRTANVQLYNEGGDIVATRRVHPGQELLLQYGAAYFASSS